MTTEYLKIISVEEGTEISKIIRSIYGSLHYLLETVSPEEDIHFVLKKRLPNLLIIDNSVADYSASDIRLISQTNPHLYIILISIDISLLKSITNCSHIRLIAPDELVTKFPLLLSDVYSDFSSAVFSGLSYGKLLKESLNKIIGFVLIVNSDGEIIFLNQAGETLFGLKDGIYQRTNIKELLVEGRKNWKYIIESSSNTEKNPLTFLLKFINTRDEIVLKNISIQRIEIDKPYFLLQEKNDKVSEIQPSVEQEHPILEKFAESIANELLNPVNVVSGRLQLIRQASGENKQNEKNLDAINRQVQRIDEIIAKLLTFARLKEDFIPQKVQINEVLQNLRMDPSISRLIERSAISLTFDVQHPSLTITGQAAHFDLLFKTLLEISFDCLGSTGKISVQTSASKELLQVDFVLHYPQAFYSDDLSLTSFLGETDESTHRKSIETTIIKQIIRQYHGTTKLLRLDEQTEKIELLFQIN